MRARVRGLRRFRAAAAILAVLLVLLPAAPSAAGKPSAYQQILAAYQATGTIPPCRFTTAQLQLAQRGIDTYEAQYSADFSTAIQNALSGRAAGGCEHGNGGTLGQAPHLHTGGLRGDAIIDTPVTAATGAGLPLPLLVAAILALALLLVLGLSTLRRPRGSERSVAPNLQHLLGEAELRSTGLLAELEDRVRSGR